MPLAQELRRDRRGCFSGSHQGDTPEPKAGEQAMEPHSELYQARLGLITASGTIRGQFDNKNTEQGNFF